jgi:Mg2+ and Co2+ transporter CorA
MDHASKLNELTMEKFSRHIDCEIYQSGEDLNRVMKYFSVISILFMPPSVVAGVFGMNVKVPYMVSDNPGNDSLWPFYNLLVITALWSTGMYLFMR